MGLQTEAVAVTADRDEARNKLTAAILERDALKLPKMDRRATAA
jgi:hypothetical protein